MQPTELAARIVARNTELEAHETINFVHYGPVLQDRADRYAAHLASMVITPDIALWERGMVSKYGANYPRVHFFIAHSWLNALLVCRYGEEPNAFNPSFPNGIDEATGATYSTDPNFAGWPTSLTEGDLKVADRWLRGDWRNHGAFVSYAPVTTEIN